MNNRSPVLEWMEPPADGLRTLHGRMAQRARRRLITAGCAAIVVVAGTLLQNWRNVPGQGQPLDEFIARHSASEAGARPPLRVVNGAALELPSPSSNARIYLVSSRAGQQSPESG